MSFPAQTWTTPFHGLRMLFLGIYDCRRHFGLSLSVKVVDLHLAGDKISLASRFRGLNEISTVSNFNTLH